MMPNVELHPDQLRGDDQRGALSLSLRIGKAMMKHGSLLAGEPQQQLGQRCL